MRRVLSILVALSFLIGSAAHAVVTIVISGSGTATPSSPTSGQAIALDATSGSVLFKVYADSSTDIGHITLTGSATSVDLLIGNSGSFPGSQSSGLSSALSRDWGGLALSSFSGSVRVAAAVGRDLTDDVTANQIFRLEVGNDIDGVVTATDVDNSVDHTFAVGPVIVGHSITSSGGVSATATPGGGQTLTIKDVETGIVSFGSDLAGTVSTDHGTILSVIAGKDLSGSVSGAVLGDSSDPGGADAIEVGLNPEDYGALSGSIACSGNMYGNVSITSLTEGGSFNVSGDLDASLYGVTAAIVGGDFIGNLTCDDLISLDVGGTFGGTVYTGSVGTFHCDVFSGVIIGNEAGDYISIATFDVDSISHTYVAYPTVYCLDFDTFDIHHGDDASATLYFTSIPSGHFVRIGDSVFDSWIVVPYGGLEGQIVLNAQGSASPAFSNGRVLVGTGLGDPVIDTPYYSYSASDLGGGAAGQVPYHLYKQDCKPAYNPDGACGFDVDSEVWPPDTSHPSVHRPVIKLRHYGPVFNSGMGVPLDVSVRSLALCSCGIYGDQADWTDAYAGDFEVYVPGDGSREVWISRVLDGGGAPQDFSTDYELKIDTLSDSGHTLLRSDHTFATTAPDVGGYPYYINPLCPFTP